MSFLFYNDNSICNYLLVQNEVEGKMKKGLVLGVLFLSMVMILGCAPKPAESNEVFVSFFNETGNETATEPTIVVIEPEAPSVTGEVTGEIPETVTTVQVVTEPTPVTPPGTPVKTYTEGQLVVLIAKATDADNDNLAITYSSPIGSDGTWQTKEGDAGQYKVEITASDGQEMSKKELLLIIQPLNKPPVITVPSEITVKEGDTVTLSPVITDADNDQLTVSYSGWMNSPSYATGFSDAGAYIVTIIASDGKASVAKDVKVIVENVNRAPVISQIAPVSVTEGDFVKVIPVVSDADNDKLTVTFTEPLNNEGTWQTKEGDAGSYDVTATISDGSTSATESFNILVAPLNRAPVIQRITDVSVKEGDSVTLAPVIIDPDGDSFTVSYSGWMTANTRKTGYEDSGSFVVKVTATDNKGAFSSVDVKVTMENVNRAPALEIE
jgi:hypothetical protein